MEAAVTKSLWDLRQEVNSIGSRTSNDSVMVPEDQEEKMLLSKTSGEFIAGYVEIPELAIEIERAVWQVEKSLKAKQELKEEKEELEAANKKTSKP